MNSAKYVDDLITALKSQGVPLSDVAWEAAKACVGWPYVFGARGGKTTKNGITVRQFDCRGFTYWILLAVYGWKLMGTGCTHQWNDEDNWKAKGKISEGIPEDTLVCLFYSEGGKEKKWEHTGFGYHGETVECSKGVQYSKTMSEKWTHWAVPKCVDGSVIPVPVPVTKPTIKNGSKGEYVKELQNDLLQLGYYLGTYGLEKNGVDGNFGSATATAVMQFQRDHDLTPDGICGAQTWAAIDEALKQPEHKRYTVTISNLTESQAKSLCNSYPGSTMKEE